MDVNKPKGKRPFTCDEDAVEEEREKLPYRHSPWQRSMLEEYFKGCPHPTTDQRDELSKQLGLEPKQVKFWFQNKRCQRKVRKEKLRNQDLKAENERLYRENIGMRAALENFKCPKCSVTDAELQYLGRLMLENTWLKKELERLRMMLFSYVMRADAYAEAQPQILFQEIGFPKMLSDAFPEYGEDKPKAFSNNGTTTQMFGVKNQTIEGTLGVEKGTASSAKACSTLKHD